ncbi:MAG: tRNA glutamyl-Q(34) synthetase GluQRS [Ilumatobacteraceae bacterium]|nr:tRNA glutamyl-Q(34) synthetase GluQRS [Ilumatobacteraceae bacterium]
MAGRFAPSPTGDLHIGNLRTALVAALLAHSTEREFIIRMEDLDLVTASPEFEEHQIADLAAVGVVTSTKIVRQSERFELYRNAIERLTESGDAYPCYCSRREIRAEIEAAAHAPNGNLPDGAYPGTCRNLTTAQRSEREAEGRRPALRLRTSGETYVVEDMIAGRFEGGIDDVVLARADGVPAYNLAVVVDDAVQGIDQVVRGDDLLSSTPRQMHLQRLLGLPTPEYAHVPLVLGDMGSRLAKRDGAITLRELVERGESVSAVRDSIAMSVGCQPGGGHPDPFTMWAAQWSVDSLSRQPIHLAAFDLAVSTDDDRLS